MNREGIEMLGKDLYLAGSSESDQSEIQKTFRDPELTSSYRDLGFRETFIADPEPGGTWSSGMGNSDRRTLLPPERAHHQVPPDHLGHPGDIGHPGDHHLGHLGHPGHPGNRLPSVGQAPFPSPRIQLNPGFDSRCPS